MSAPPASLAELRANAGAYPVELLDGCATALILFAAGFYGAHDAIHLADRGLDAVCVDTDHDRLQAMRRIYPSSWGFVTGDAFRYTPAGTFDLVSVDPPAALVEASLDKLPLYASLARRAIVHLILPGFDVGTVGGPTWRVDVHPRSSGAQWLTLQRALPRALP